MRLHIAVVSGSLDGPIVADLTHLAERCTWSHTLHGPRELTLSAPYRAADWASLSLLNGPLYVVATRAGRRRWAGRMAAPELEAGPDGSQITIRAYGLWEALNDLRYTALWSDTSVEGWEPAAASLGGILNNTIPDRWEIDTNNRLYIAPKKGELFGATAYAGATAVGALYYLRPSQSLRSIEYLSFTFDVTVPSADWKADMIRLNDDLTYAGSVVWTQTGSGAGGYSGAITGCGGLALRLFYTAANAAFAGESGTAYVLITDIRVRGDNTTSVYADAVAADIAADYDALNPGVLASATPVATNPGYDLTDLLFEDEEATTVINTVARRGDGAGTIYVAGVNADAYLYLHPVGTNGRTWYVDVADVRIGADREEVANQIYATYEDAGRRTLRTAVATDATSVARYGYTRQGVVEARTTSATRAEEFRNLTLTDRAFAPGESDLTFDRAYSVSGGLVDLDEILPGDTIVIRNLSLAVTLGASEIDRARSSRITETRYDPLIHKLTVVPETPLPRLDVLLAQLG